MKIKAFLITFLLILSFTTLHAEQLNINKHLAYDVSFEISEQIDESEDNRNFLLPSILFNLYPKTSESIISDPFIYKHYHISDIQKPPIYKS
jgi:hypothetical protein